MEEEKGVKYASKFRSWITAIMLACVFAVILCWSVFGIWFYLYPEQIDYSLRTTKNQASVLSLSGKDGIYFVGLPIQQIQLAEKNLPIHTLEVQIAFVIKNFSQQAEIAAKLPIIQDRLITYLRTITVEELQESGRLFYLKEALLEQVNALLFPAQIQDVLFQKIVIREGI